MNVGAIENIHVTFRNVKGLEFDTVIIQFPSI
jgi:hypothetical protein